MNDNILIEVKDWLQVIKPVNHQFLWKQEEFEEVKAIGDQSQLYPDTYIYNLLQTLLVSIKTDDLQV